MANIIVVDDDPGLAGALAWLVEEHGHVAETACDLVSARRRLEAGWADLVLVDVHLRDGSGFDLLDEIVARSGTPVVVMCGHTDSGQTERSAEERGAVAYMAKPIRPPELLAAIDAALT